MVCGALSVTARLMMWTHKSPAMLSASGTPEIRVREAPRLSSLEAHVNCISEL